MKTDYMIMGFVVGLIGLCGFVDLLAGVLS